MITYGSLFNELAKIAEHSPYGQQLRMGEKVEREHAGTIGWLKKNPDAPPSAAYRSIASEHIDEDEKYYTHLKEMEDKYKKKEASLREALKQLWLQRRREIWSHRAGKLMEKGSVYAAERTGEGGDPMQTSVGTVRG